MDSTTASTSTMDLILIRGADALLTETHRHWYGGISFSLADRTRLRRGMLALLEQVGVDSENGHRLIETAIEDGTTLEQALRG
jgi:hypothetical protein